MDATDRLFGEIAVKLGHLSREQLAECIRTQYDSAAGTTLGQIALELGYMQPPDVDAVIAQQSRMADRRKVKRAGIVEIDATQGQGGVIEERVERMERTDSRSSLSVPDNAARNQARNARTQPNQPPIASAYRSASNAKMPAVGAKTVSETPAPSLRKPDLRQTATDASGIKRPEPFPPLSEAARPSRRADRTLIGTAPGTPAVDESSPAHEAITVIPPPDQSPDAEAASPSGDPEVSFEALMSVVPKAPPTPQAAVPSAPSMPTGLSVPGLPPMASEDSFSGLDDPEISFGSLMSQAPKPPIAGAGTIHGVGAPQLTGAPPLPPTPPQAPQPTPVARPRLGTLAFASPVVPAEPQPKPVLDSPKRTATVPSFTGATPASGDVVFSSPLGQEPGTPPQRVATDNPQRRRAQSVTPTQSPASQRGTQRSAPRRASAWFSSVPALATNATIAASPWVTRATMASQEIKDAALAQLPAGNEPLAVRAMRAAHERGALDVHFHRAAPIMMRLHGAIQPLVGGAALGENAVDKTLAQIMNDTQWKRLSERGELVFMVDVPELGRARVTASRSENGCDALFRLTPTETVTLPGLNLPTSLAKLLEYESGLVVCTGPVGHGVTTTMSALINGVVTSRQAHVVTFEEAIELRMPSTRCLVSQRQLGTHVSDVARAVRAVAHEDADLVAFGDLRNAEDIALALSLAHGGHLVIAAVHARGAADCLNRLVRPFGKHDQAQARTMLAQSLRAVIGQRLVQRADGSGRVPAIELIVATPSISELIRRGQPIDADALSASGKAQKLVTLKDSLQRLVAAGTVDAAEAELVARNLTARA